MTKKIRILILNWRDPHHPFAGGAEISLFEHALFWRKSGADVIWISSNFKGGRKEENILGIRVFRYGTHYSVHLLTFFAIRQKKFGAFDIVIDCFHFIPFFTPLYLRRKKILALINEVAGKLWYVNLPYPLAIIGYYLEILSLALYKNYDFITSSDSTKRELIKYGIPKENINLIHHGFTMYRPGKEIKKENNPTFIFLSRISVDKGIKDALLAFKIIKDRIKDAKFWVVGREEKYGIFEELLSKILSSKIYPSIKYFGFVSEEKKFELLKKSWFLIHPSHKEGWGLNVIEAASLGTPTLGYDVEGLRDSIVDGKTGILTRPNPQDIAENAIRLIMDKRKYQKISIQAEKWSRNFSWRKSILQSWKLLIGEN